MEGGSKTVPLALHGQAQELGLEQLCEEAAHAIRSSDIRVFLLYSLTQANLSLLVLVATGAGMSADSGTNYFYLFLPVFNPNLILGLAVVRHFDTHKFTSCTSFLSIRILLTYLLTINCE